MKSSHQFQKKSASQSAPISQSGVFASRPFRKPEVPARSDIPQVEVERDSNGNPAWWSRLQPEPPRYAVQPKLTVGAPNDVYEQEADRVADQVMSMPDAATQPPVQREGKHEEDELQTKPLAATITPLVQREAIPEEEDPVQKKASGNADIQREERPEEEEVLTKPLSSGTLQRQEMPEEHEELQMKSLCTADLQRTARPEEDESLQPKSSSTPEAPHPTPSLETQLSNTQGSGSPLPNDVRSFMEPRFGADFSQVRVHTGSDAVQMNRDLNAQAFTHKQDVYFGAGKAPGNNALTAHELTHVVQQADKAALQMQENSNVESSSKEGEAIFARQGEQSINNLKGTSSNTDSSGGHTGAGNVSSFAPWFSQLQKLLIERTTWGKEEEEAQNLLRSYAEWKVKISPNGAAHASLEHMFKYIGRSEKNDASNKKYGTPHAGDLGGSKGSENWCAQASHSALTNSLRDKGLRFKGGFEQWLSKGKGKSKVVSGKGAHTAKLNPGDIISLVGAKTPVSGHVATVIEEKGDTILMVSGNAGGGGGSIRIDEVKRGQPPETYNWLKSVTEKQEKKPGTNAPAESGEIWVVSIEQMSQVDPSQIDPKNDQQLEELGLEHILTDSKKKIRRKRLPNAALPVVSNLESRLNSSQGGGSPLPNEVRSFMEPRFGADFSQVRVHTGSDAVQMNRDLNAQAFTHKQDLYFGIGKAPAIDSLTAHELTHVVQQTGEIQTKLSCKQVEEQLQRQSKDTDEVQASVDISNWLSIVKEYKTIEAQPSIDQIKANRGKINTRDLIAKGKGFMYTAGAESKSSKADKEDQQSAKEHLEWQKTAEPNTAQGAVSEEAKLTKLITAQKELWNDIANEGDTSAMNTYDSANVTWGRGFAAAGQLQSFMSELFKLDSGVREEFFNAGICLANDKKGNPQFVVVDVENSVKRFGDDAEHVIQSDQQLVSLFINIAQSKEHRQSVLDAQWNQLIKSTAKIPKWALDWSRESRAVIGHNVHFGGSKISWKAFEDTGGDMAKVVAKLADLAPSNEKEVRPNGAVIMLTTKRVITLAKGYAKTVLEGPMRIGSTTISDPISGEETARTDGFESTYIYFKTTDGQYYALKRN